MEKRRESTVNVIDPRGGNLDIKGAENRMVRVERDTDIEWKRGFETKCLQL